MAEASESKVTTLTWWTLGALGLMVLCYLANALLGPLNQDEGWYLYAARLMTEGELPHKDFFFTQGKLMPAVYACFAWAWSAAGVLGGRLFTAVLSSAALLLACRTIRGVLTKATDQKFTVLVFLALTGVNLWYTYFTTIPKTYGLCTFGIALALYLLRGRTPDQMQINAWRVALSGVVLAALVDVRLSMGVLLPTVAIWLLCYRHVVGRMAWLVFSSAAGGTLLALFLPEVLCWPEAFFEAQRFHAARESMGLVGVIGCLARLLRFNPVLCFIGVLIGWTWCTERAAFKTSTHAHLLFPKLWLICATMLMMVHLLAPVPYDDYLVPAVFLGAMALAVLTTELPFDSLKNALPKVLFLAAAALSICASPVAQDWVIAGQDRFWVVTKPAPDIVELRKVAAQVREAAERLGEDTIWTQDTYLAVEAGLRVPAGMEMGPFSKPTQLKIYPKLAAWSGYTYALSYPSLAPDPMRETKLNALEKTYGRRLLTHPQFGQGCTQLVVAERTNP